MLSFMLTLRAHVACLPMSPACHSCCLCRYVGPQALLQLPLSQVHVTHLESVLLQVPSQGMWAHDNSRVFDDRAVSIVEEAISKEVLPKFRCAAPQSHGNF